MPFDFNKGIPVQTPGRLQKRGVLEQIGGFLAPTTTKAVKGLAHGEAPSGRELLGAGLEIGSFLLPAGAIGRGLGFLGKAARAGKAVKAKPSTPFSLETLQTGVRETGQKLKQQTKTAAQVGGVSGAMAGAGRELGEEDSSLKDILGAGAIGGTIGAAGGAVLAPAFSITSMGAKGIAGVTSNTFRKIKTQLHPEERSRSVDDLTKSISSSFVEDKPSILNKLEVIAGKARRKGEKVDESSLIRETVEEGYIPKVEGEVARYGGAIDDAFERIEKLADGVGTIAKRIKTPTKLSDLKEAAKKELTGRTDVDFEKATKQVDALYSSLKKEFGESVSAETVNIIRKKMNRATRSFKAEAFVQDAANAFGSATRDRLDEFAPEIRILNAESGRLSRIIDTMDVFNNRKIDVGFFASGAGRFVGTVGASAAGLSVGGPGGLVIAGLMAQVGSRTVANLIRQARFNPKMQEIIRRGIRNDQKLLNELVGKSSKEDAALIKRFAGQKSFSYRPPEIEKLLQKGFNSPKNPKTQSPKISSAKASPSQKMTGKKNATAPIKSKSAISSIEAEMKKRASGGKKDKGAIPETTNSDIPKALEKEIRGNYIKADVPLVREKIKLEDVRGKGLKQGEVPSGKEDMSKPIIVARMKGVNGKTVYQLLDGRHRIARMLTEGKTKVDAVVGDSHGSGLVGITPPLPKTGSMGKEISKRIKKK